MSSRFDLKKLYANESPAQKYKRVTSGKESGWALFVAVEVVMMLCVWLPGALGIVVRKLFYPLIFARLPFSVVVNKQVTFRCPAKIHVSDGVFFDEFSQVQALSSHECAIQIGCNSVVNSFCILNAGEPEGHIFIGDNTVIGQGTIIYGNGGVDIGSDVLIAGQCFIVASSHNFDVLDIPISRQGICVKGISIEDGAWIGAGVKILDGVTIGEGAIIGANSVVTSSIPPYTVAVGAPCRVVRTRSD